MVRADLKVLFLLLYGTSALMLYGQGKSELYLFNLVKSQDGQYHVFGPKYLSGFNPGGYTNQPYFTPSGDLLVSVRKAGESQNDIWLLSPVLKKCRQITNTTASEYSPQIEPGGDYYSVIRQVEGSPIDQQVYQFPLLGGHYESLTPDVQDIGYYGWLNPGELGLYRIEGESNRL
ncbi:MAG TPA: hypothetical protein VJ508_14005, partial [Saprospiraceae bacterium]|nr:hypothetical protein [Saprospiraceae bacterium]